MSHISYLGTPKITQESNAMYFFPYECSEADLSKGTITYHNTTTATLKQVQDSRWFTYKTSYVQAGGSSVPRKLSSDEDAGVKAYDTFDFCSVEGTESPAFLTTEISACGKTDSVDLPIKKCPSGFFHTLIVKANPFF
jgi:hypothetical protein